MTFKDNKPEPNKHIDSGGTENYGYGSLIPKVSISAFAGNGDGISGTPRDGIPVLIGARNSVDSKAVFLRSQQLGSTAEHGLSIVQYDEAGVMINKRGYRVTLHIDNLGAVGTYHLVDLTDYATYPHPNPSSDTDIIVRSVKVEINGNTAFRGDIHMGYLSDVDADNGNFEHLMGWHFDLRELTVSEFLRYPAGLAKSGLTNHNLTDDVRFQTDENLTAGLTESPAGNNDLVLLVDLTAGNVDFEIVLEYDIE